MTSDSTPVFALEKEALKAEIETGLQVGVDHLEDKPMKRKPVEKYHNTRHLLKQYRKVAYAIQISESDMNVRMEMEHGTRLSTLEVNAELAGVDLSGSKLEGYPIMSIIVADKILFADINADQMYGVANELNLDSVTGWHSVFLADDSMIYMYRQCLWLSMNLTYEDLLAMLKECISEYKRGKGRLTTGDHPTNPVA